MHRFPQTHRRRVETNKPPHRKGDPVDRQTDRGHTLTDPRFRQLRKGHRGRHTQRRRKKKSVALFV